MRHFIALLVTASLFILGAVFGFLVASEAVESAHLETQTEKARCLDLLEDNNAKWKKVIIEDAIDNP